jgi:site-specific DNA-methyltransferase (adenine-specific)
MASSLPGGFNANASPAERYFNASLALLKNTHELSVTAPAISREAENCLGEDVKPNFSPVVMARKPLGKGRTVAANVLEHGTGAINIDTCRIEGVPYSYPNGPGGNNSPTSIGRDKNGNSTLKRDCPVESNPSGRFPANIIHDGSPEVLAVFPESVSTPHAGAQLSGSGTNEGWRREAHQKDFPKWAPYADSGSAARFFYCAKSSKGDRDAGLEGMKANAAMFAEHTGLKNNGDGSARNQTPLARNNHPCVKPVDLMRYLCRLVTRRGGLILDPFMGSGSTGKAAMMEGFRFIGIEREEKYCEIAARRMVGQRELALEFPE